MVGLGPVFILKKLLYDKKKTPELSGMKVVEKNNIAPKY